MVLSNYMLKTKSKRGKIDRYGSKNGTFETNSKLIRVTFSDWLVFFFLITPNFFLSHFTEKKLFGSLSLSFLESWWIRKKIELSTQSEPFRLNPKLQRTPPVFKPSDELSGSHVRRR